MVKMSKLADYAFILLTQMIAEERESWSASELASRTTLPLPTVAKVMKMLARSRVVMAQRGATGGYRLTKPAASISIADIIEAVDGPIAITDCVDEREPCCAVQTLCPMCNTWSKVNDAMRAALGSVSLSDLSPSPVTSA